MEIYNDGLIDLLADLPGVKRSSHSTLSLTEVYFISALNSWPKYVVTKVYCTYCITLSLCFFFFLLFVLVSQWCGLCEWIDTDNCRI